MIELLPVLPGVVMCCINDIRSYSGFELSMQLQTVPNASFSCGKSARLLFPRVVLLLFALLTHVFKGKMTNFGKLLHGLQRNLPYNTAVLYHAEIPMGWLNFGCTVAALSRHHVHRAAVAFGKLEGALSVW